MVPLIEAVSVPFVAKLIDDDRHLEPNDTMEEALVAVLDELVRVDRRHGATPSAPVGPVRPRSRSIPSGAHHEAASGRRD